MMNEILLGYEEDYALELAYWAGLFDGEGSIGIYRYQNKDRYHKSPTYTVYLNLVLTDKQTVDSFASLFKGSRAIRQEYKRNPNARTQYYWASRGNTAITILKALRPLLRLKTKQADLALEFHERKGSNPCRLLTNSEIMLRESYYQRMKQLNMRGKKNG